MASKTFWILKHVEYGLTIGMPKQSPEIKWDWKESLDESNESVQNCNDVWNRRVSKQRENFKWKILFEVSDDAAKGINGGEG